VVKNLFILLGNWFHDRIDYGTLYASMLIVRLGRHLSSMY